MSAPRTLIRGAALVLTGAFAACADTGPAGLDFPDLESDQQIESCQPSVQMDGSLLNGSNDDLLEGPKGKKGGWGGTSLKTTSGGTESTTHTSGTSTSSSTTDGMTGTTTTINLKGAKSTSVGAANPAALGICPS